MPKDRGYLVSALRILKIWFASVLKKNLFSLCCRWVANYQTGDYCRKPPSKSTASINQQINLSFVIHANNDHWTTNPHNNTNPVFNPQPSNQNHFRLAFLAHWLILNEKKKLLKIRKINLFSLQKYSLKIDHEFFQIFSFIIKSGCL